jgi:hypothetical protein
MVHCTIKGFTRLAQGASPEDFMPALDELFARTPAFETEIGPPWVSGSGAGGESVLLWMPRSEPLLALHAAVWDIVAPYVAHDCLFTPVEPHGDDFPPHITLVQADLPGEVGLLEQGKTLAQHVYDKLPTHSFTAQDIQLVEFHSGDWAGRWWETLRFKQLKGWRLPG